ncbi:MAG: hypothetical protein AB1509_06275 [Chloroflexota bacterium]
MNVRAIVQSQYLAALANKLELQIYNIRHIQQHTGELYERLRRYDVKLNSVTHLTRWREIYLALLGDINVALRENCVRRLSKSQVCCSNDFSR